MAGVSGSNQDELSGLPNSLKSVSQDSEKSALAAAFPNLQDSHSLPFAICTSLNPTSITTTDKTRKRKRVKLEQQVAQLLHHPADSLEVTKSVH